MSSYELTDAEKKAAQKAFDSCGGGVEGFTKSLQEDLEALKAAIRSKTNSSGPNDSNQFRSIKHRNVDSNASKENLVGLRAWRKYLYKPTTPCSDIGSCGS